jgi:hypothetical protein
MKARHAAALALIGWYLMVPLQTIRNQRWAIDRDAPLSKWEINGSFDSVKECQREKIAQSEEVRKEALKAVKEISGSEFSQGFSAAIPPWAVMADLIWQQSGAAVCVATDDPRLNKGK